MVRAKSGERESVASLSDKWPKESFTKDQFAIVLLKKKGFFGPVYLLEHRKNDPVYGNRFALFGGTRENDKESPRATAVREVGEETGLEISETKLRKIAYVEGESSRLAEAEGFIYVYEFERDDHNTVKSKIEKYQADHRPPDTGPPIAIWRIFGIWFGLLNWSRLAPQAAFALLADRDADRRR